MTIYIALLRGINVGGHKLIKMVELKHMFEELGYRRVQTYIQSGNVVFEADKDEELLQTEIENEINKVFGFTVSVMLRTAEQLERIIDKCPFSADGLTGKQSIHLTFLKETPSQEVLDKLPDIDLEEDEYLFDGRELYLLYRKSVLDSNLTKKFQKLAPATSRNWKTIIKLAAMTRATEAGH